MVLVTAPRLRGFTYLQRGLERIQTKIRSKPHPVSHAKGCLEYWQLEQVNGNINYLLHSSKPTVSAIAAYPYLLESQGTT